MNIGILCYPSSGGSGVVATEMGAALARRGHEVHVVSYRAPFRHRPSEHRFHFHAVEMPSYPLFEYPSYGMAAACTLAGIVERHDLDLLHVHYAYPHAASAHLAREMTRRPGLRVVTTLHGTDITLVRQDESFASLTRFGIERSDAVTAVSAFLKSSTEAWLGCGRRIEVIPNFVDPERFRPRARRTPAAPVVVHVSNFRPVKRSLDAVRAFKLLRKRRPARLLLVGLGPEHEEARHLASRLGLEDDVVFRGEVPDIERVLSASDLLLSTSEFEGFGLAPLEAMSCGLPVVATLAGGISEVVVDGTTGRLVPVGDVDALAAAMDEVLGDRALAARYGAAGRARAEAEYNPAKILARYEALYERLLTNAAPAAGDSHRG